MTDENIGDKDVYTPTFLEWFKICDAIAIIPWIILMICILILQIIFIPSDIIRMLWWSLILSSSVYVVIGLPICFIIAVLLVLSKKTRIKSNKIETSNKK